MRRFGHPHGAAGRARRRRRSAWSAWPSLQPDTPLPLMLGCSRSAAIFRSVGFSAYNSVAFADVAPDRMTHANTLHATLQELGAGLGVAVGALLVRLGEPAALALGLAGGRRAVPGGVRAARGDHGGAAGRGAAAQPRGRERGHRPGLTRRYDAEYDCSSLRHERQACHGEPAAGPAGRRPRGGGRRCRRKPLRLRRRRLRSQLSRGRALAELEQALGGRPPAAALEQVRRDLGLAAT